MLNNHCTLLILGIVFFFQVIVHFILEILLFERERASN